jgi:hypothetical protein
MQLGELAADGGGAIRRQLSERPQRFRQPLRGLEGDQCLRRLQDALELAGAPRQESLEAETMCRQAGGDESDEDRRGAGKHLEVEVSVDAGPDQPVAGIRDRRHPRVGDQRDTVPALDSLSQLASTLSLIALVVGDQPPVRLDIEPVEEQPRPTGVLAGDQVGLVQGPASPQGDVLEVPDRRRADDQLPGHDLALLVQLDQRHRPGADQSGVRA